MNLTRFSHFFHRRWVRVVGFVGGGLAVLWLAGFVFVPRRLFDDPVSTLLYSRRGELLSARIAADGQWRFPESDSLPERFARCLVEYEDRRFAWHPGIDPVAVVRAVWQNSRSGRVVSGGSTLSMQLARRARGGRPRTVGQKLIEAAWALHIESTRSKDRILRLYASHAPFGGNVVGLEAAAWRWFGRNPWQLSWAESAMLAVLPNSPAMIHPGRNRDALLEKRNRLLGVLAERRVIDSLEWSLAISEPLPDEPVPLPDLAPHLLDRLAAESGEPRTVSTLDGALQRAVQQTVNRAARDLEAARIHNIAAIVADVATGRVVAYAGNVTDRHDPSHGERVDIIAAERSTGSLLKPLLYTAMLDDGALLPGTLVADTPLNINGFTPSNYDREFHGAVPAREAISRSLNVPLVRMLSRYNTGRFRSLLREAGMTTLRHDEEHYGASLILGGAEGTLWDMAGMYASMARVLGNFGTRNGRYDRADIHPLTVDPATRLLSRPALSSRPILSAAAIWSAFEAMSEVNRPEEEAEWQSFSSMRRVAWKTGTSYGSRDAWSIGLTPRWVVGVWVGNASGEGRAGLTGVGAAAPVMFDIFSMLPPGDGWLPPSQDTSPAYGDARRPVGDHAGSAWFETPYDELVEVAVCRHSGHRASEICELVDTLLVPRAGIDTPVCPYHRLVHLSPDGRWQVNSGCEPLERITTRPWFVLPPAQEFYYRRHNPSYEPLPPVRADCREVAENIDVVYPDHGAEVFVPRGFDGRREQIILSAAHSDRDATIFWWLDGGFAGETRGNHRMAIQPVPGPHTLTLTDAAGNRRVVAFTVRE